MSRPRSPSVNATPGLFRSEGKEHLLVLCWLDQADRTAIRTAPLHNPVGHGMFATCSHNWPNPIGLSCFWRHRCVGRDDPGPGA
ncbi:MAG: TrmO family methyltransferase [Methanoculleus sp.]